MTKNYWLNEDSRTFLERGYLKGETPEERIEAHRVGMDGDGEHVGPGIENALRAIAVVQVDIENGDAGGLFPKMLRGDCRIVEEAAH